MEARNIDFEIPLDREQWDQIGRTAAALSPDGSGLRWSKSDPERIDVRIRDEDAPTTWRRFVVEENRYGEHERQVANFLFNDGRPYAELIPPQAPDEPAISDAEEKRMEAEIQSWVRNKWHDLLAESGIDQDRGHLPYDRG